MREPLFIIAAPRSYTSVIGTMLGQHPQAYGLPEVSLSHADTLGQMWGSVMNQIGLGTAGLLRTLAELHDGAQTEEAVLRAEQWIADHSHWTGGQVFHFLQDLIGPERMMVDKSLRNTSNADNLRRLAAAFPNANYLHLTRHPRSTCNSVVSLMKDQGKGKRKSDPELTWLRVHTNIVEFMEDLAPGQVVRVKGEALLCDPKLYLDQICEWLDIDRSNDAIEAMLRPEESPFASVGPASAPYGADPNFLNNPKLDFDRLAKLKEASLDGPLEWKSGENFSPPVVRLALQLGYI